MTWLRPSAPCRPKTLLPFKGERFISFARSNGLASSTVVGWAKMPLGIVAPAFCGYGPWNQALWWDVTRAMLSVACGVSCI